MPTNPIPAVPIPTARYYPRLSEIVTVDDLPEFLSFVENGLNSIFDKIHYKNLQYSKGYRGDSAFYSLDIVTGEKLAIPLPFGLGLILNPDLNGNSSISSFPITLEYQWEILAFLKTFSSSTFSFSVKDFYSVGLQVFRISEEQVIAHMLNTFVVAQAGKTKYEQLLADINTLPELVAAPGFTELKFPEGVEQSINGIVTLINNSTFIKESIPLLLFAIYILKSDLGETKQKLQEFYNIMVPDGIEAHIKRIITPKAKASLALSAGIEFPRSILKPVTDNGAPFGEEQAKSMFVFGKAQLYADTEEGIGYQLELGGSLAPSKYAMIGNTGLILQLDTLKVDLSKKTNIPEADIDGRPNDFVGVYARAVSVALPSKWFRNPDEKANKTIRIGASELLVGTGGLSGKIYLETIPDTTNTFNYFNDKFGFNYPIKMFERGADDVAHKKEISNYQSLLVFLQELNSKNLPYSFDYPLSLKTLPTIDSTTVKPATTYSFNDAKEYQTFLSALYPDNTLWKTIGSSENGFKVGFNKFDITFKQNKVVESNIKGAIEIPKLKKGDNPFLVGVEGHLYDDGDFNLTASFSKENPQKANLFDLVDLDFHSFELGKQDDDYYLGTSCTVSFPETTLMGTLMEGKGFKVEKLRLYSDGNIEVEGGSIPIPVSLAVNLGPVKMSVTNINFGSTQINNRKYNFWGFDGAISINPLGVDARGEGIKYYYSTDGGPKDSFLRIQTIEVDLIIPGTATEASAMAIIHGMISLPEPGKSKEFMGEVSLKLPKAKISGGVGMRFMPKYPAFLIDANIDLPVPIPLGFLAISAFRGLLGFRYVATKEAAGLKKEDSWYDYYKHPKPGINIRKFSGPPDSMQYSTPFSIGAGATFGTVADGGHVLSLRAMLLLSLPTLFYIEAGLNVISGRLGLIETDPSNPPFFAMVAFGDDSLELAAGADFSIPKDSGQIFQLHALLEAGFFFKNQKPWYVNIGSKKDPITARILTLFTAKAYIMLSAQGIEAGARLEFKLQQSFGPAKVKLWAYLELGGKISFKRPQMGGYIAAGGGIQIKLWIINVEIALDTIFSVESFRPFLIYAKLELSVRVKIAFVRVRRNFVVELQWDINRTVDLTPYSPLPMGTEGDGEDNRTLENVKGVHMLTNQAFALDYFPTLPDGNAIKKVIPLDTYIDIKMAKGLLPNSDLSTKIGGYTGDAKNYTDMMPPVSTQAGRKLRQVKHQYAIKSIAIKSWNGTAWENYHPFEAVVENKTATRELVQNLPWAQWQKAIDQYDSIRVLATDPFSFLSAGEPGWQVPEQFGITPSKLFCKSESIKNEQTNFLNKPIGKRYYVPTQYEADKINGLYFKLIGEAPEIIENNRIEGGDFMSITGGRNPHNYRKSLSFENYNELEIIFPESAIEPILKITTQAREVKIKAYTAIVKKEGDKLITYEPVKIRKSPTDPIVEELSYTKAELLKAITIYDEKVDPISKTKIDKIVITPIAAKAQRIKAIRNEIAALFNTTYNAANGNSTISVPTDTAKYNQLLTELNVLKIEAGNDVIPSEAPNNTLSFTRYYGYKGKEPFVFDRMIKYRDTYIITFQPQADKTVLLQLDAKGNILRERLLDGIVTVISTEQIGYLTIMQSLNAKQCKTIGQAVVNDDFIVGCQIPEASTLLADLDPSLEPLYSTQYFTNSSLGYNDLLYVGEEDKLWINTLQNETHINWLAAGTNMKRLKIDVVVVKAIKLNDTESCLITKDKKLIYLHTDIQRKTITITDTKLLSDTTISEITDAAFANGKILLSVKKTNEKFALVEIDGTTTKMITNDTIFDSAIQLSGNVLNNESIFAHNAKYLFAFDFTMQLKRLIERGSPEEKNTIIKAQNEALSNEIIMLSSKPKEKGIYFSLFNDQFDNCALRPQATVSLISTIGTLTNSNITSSNLTLMDEFIYANKLKSSNYITTNDILCTNAGSNDKDEELYYKTSVQSIEWLSKESHFHNSTIPLIEAVQADNKAMQAAVQNTVQPIWRPNTTYCLDFVLTDTVNDKKTTEFTYFYGFKTMGPMGHYSVPDPVGQPTTATNELTNLSKSPLTSLRQYLDYNRSYPNADGSLLQAKPVFYGNEQCKIALFFSNPYVYHMFKDWDVYGNRDKIEAKLNLIIKDPLNDVLIPFPLPKTPTSYPKPEEKESDWVSDNDPKIPLGIQMINNFITGNPKMDCTLVLGKPLKPKSFGYVVQLTNLKPSKLYTVLANNYYKMNPNSTIEETKNTLVHQFGFQTSRYKDFKEQVLSYKASDGSHKALYDVKLNLAPDQIEALWAVSNAQPNTLSDGMALKYQHPFDRAIEGILKMSPLDPAQTTEVNKIINTNTNEVIALLIRNPEPFNIPKIPLKELKDSIKVVYSAADVAADPTKVLNEYNEQYKVLYSKDYAQVLLVHDNKKIPKMDLNILFEYRMWNNEGIQEGTKTPLTLSVAKQLLEI
ncbi:hypothetical protein [Flavobacterium poyangense]|uniref:hypothetical protein n=1 Tax=Flavobacterium poyangense TaxID=2204302 RepID=UPI00141DA600|nr:hypothetical protein [Flavobacterium sp. JXAS1]